METDKKFFHFNGLVWERVSDITGIAYNLLKPIILHYIKTTDPENPVAFYNKHTGLLDRFVRYFLEIGKRSYIKRIH